MNELAFPSGFWNGTDVCLGVTECDLLDSYSSLGAVDLANACAFAGIHAAQIDSRIRANEKN